MSSVTSYKDLWPTDDSTWDSPKDVVLVLHLATLASGYTPNINLAARPTPTRTSHAFLRCVEPKKPHRTGCQATLLYLEYLTRSKKGNGPCKVHLPPRSKDTQKLCDHHGGEDSGHSECVGPLERATEPFHLTVGARVYTKREVSRIEAGLKSTGRRNGYAIQSRHTKDVLVKCLGESDQGPCKWQVRLIPGKGKDGQGNEVEGHTASEIDPEHQCEPKLPKPSEPLRQVLDYFPEITLTAGLIGKSKRQQVRKKPKGKMIPATPDYATDSSDEDGVMSDSGLQRRCEELIALCPPADKSAEGNDPSSLEPPANASGAASTTGSIEHTTLTAPASALGLSSAAASPAAGGGRDTRDPSSSLSPVQSEAADDSMYEEPPLVDAGAEDDEDDESYGGDSEEEKPRASKRARLARGKQLQQEEQQRRATRRSLGKGKEVSYKEVWDVEGLEDEVIEEKPQSYEGVEQPTIEDLKPIEDIKPAHDVKPIPSHPPAFEDSIIPDSSAPSPAIGSSAAGSPHLASAIERSFTGEVPIPTAAHLASTTSSDFPPSIPTIAAATATESEVDLSMFVDLDSSAPATQEKFNGSDKMGEIIQGGEHKIVVDQMLPSAAVEEKIGMDLDA